MSNKIQRFEYIVWFKGRYLEPEEIAEHIHKLLETKGVQPVQAQYGTIMVPDEDVGEPYRDSKPKARNE